MVKILILTAILAMAVITACSVTGTDESQAVTVTKTVDGMTFELTSDGGSNTAKLMAVDDSVIELMVPKTVTDDSGGEYTVTSVGAIGGKSTNHANLVSAKFPETVVSADSYLFGNCSALVSVDLPGLSKIPEYAFSSCKQLAEVSFSDKVESIGSYSFQYTIGLKNLTINCAPEVSVGKTVFYSSGSGTSEIHFFERDRYQYGHGLLPEM